MFYHFLYKTDGLNVLSFSLKSVKTNILVEIVRLDQKPQQFFQNYVFVWVFFFFFWSENNT